MLYLNGAVGQKDTDVELYILLLHYGRTPDPESNFQQYIPPQVNIKKYIYRTTSTKYCNPCEGCVVVVVSRLPPP
jgi:hypothetical protein